MSALLLSAIFSPWWETSITLAADGLLAVELLGKKSKGRIINSSTKTEYQMEGGLLLDVVVGEGTSILELLSCEDETLLIRRDSFLVLNLGLDVVNSVRWLNIERDGLT